MDYEYWVVRYVPNIARGEFTNIGLVCGRDGADWDVRFATRHVRNRGNLSSDLRELSGWTRWFSLALRRNEGLSMGSEITGRGWIENLRSRQANSIQFSEPIPIAVQTAQEGIEILFPHLVEREPSRRRREMSRATLRADLRDTLMFEKGLQQNVDLFMQPKARIGRQRGSFDILRSDSPSEQLMNVWAFNVATLENLEREVQSWNYLVSRFRSDGARLTLNAKREVDISASTPIDVVYDPPRQENENAWRTDIFEAAREAWALNNVRAISQDDFHRTPALLERA